SAEGSGQDLVKHSVEPSGIKAEAVARAAVRRQRRREAGLRLVRPDGDVSPHAPLVPEDPPSALLHGKKPGGRWDHASPRKARGNPVAAHHLEKRDGEDPAGKETL